MAEYRDERPPVVVPEHLRFPSHVEDWVDFERDLVPTALRDRYSSVDEFVTLAVIAGFIEHCAALARWRDENQLRPRDVDEGRATRPRFRDEGMFRATAALWLRGRE